MRILFSTILLSLFLSLHLFAQGDKTVASYSVRGQIADENGVPVELAVVSLMRNDSTLISYAITDSTGLFEIQAEYSGEAILCTSHIGYESYTARVSVPADQFQNIVLKPSVSELNVAEVVGDKPAIEMTKDGNVRFNVSQVRGNANTDITGILNRLPGVTASQKQGLTLNGQQATLYIDGRKQSFSGQQAINILKTMPAEDIDNVELIYYTGAGYEASTGPIINIVTNKRKDDGWNISINGSGTADRENNWDGGGSAYVIARSGNVNIYGSLDYYNGVISYVQRDSTVNASDYLLEQTETYNRSNTYSGLANVEWLIKPNHALNFNLYVYKERMNSDMADKSVDSQSSSEGASIKDGRTVDDLFSGTVEYAATFNESLKLKLNYGLIYGGTENFDAYQLQDNIDGMRALSDMLKLRGTEHVIKADLTKQFKKTDLAVGAKIDIGNLRNDVSYSGDIPSWIEPNTEFRGRENIYAMYAEASHKFNDKFSMDAGLRGELTDYRTKNITEKLDERKSYFNLFPSWSLTHRAKNVHQTLYFFSTISRPSYEYLYPGMRYETEYSYSVGNPSLEPMKAYSIKYVGYYWTYARFALGYQRSNDSFTRVLQGQGQNLTSYTYVNYADQNLYLADFTIPFAFFKQRLFGSIDVRVRYYQLTNPKNGYEIPYAKADLWYTKVSGYIQYDITDRLSLNGEFAYYPKRTAAQYVQKPYWWLDFGLDYCLTKKKNWLISLNVEDVANKLEHNRTYHYSNSIKFRYTKSVTQLVRFRLTWKFGGGKEVDDEEKYISNDISRFRD